MNMKALLLLPGTLALMLATSPLIPGFTSAAVAQSMQRQGNGQGWESQLGLNADQKAKIQQIHQTERQQMKDVLTQDQQTAMQQARANHTRPNISLSDDQQQKMKAIHEDAETQINAVLNPDQQAKYQQWQQNHQRRQQQ